MGVTVCLSCKCLTDPELGGHMWVYLKWALGLRQLGCRVIWLELVEPSSMEKLATLAELLKNRLTRYGLSDSLALGFPTEQRPGGCIPQCLDVDAAVEADLLLNMGYDIPLRLLARFRRTALVDIDPGLTQIWLSALSANRLRSVLTSLGIVLGVAALVCMVAIGERARAQISEQISKLGTNLLLVKPYSHTAARGKA